MVEVEIKVKLTDSKTEDIKNKLLTAGFMKKSFTKETDVYYTSDYHDCKKLDEALRVRTVEDLSAEKMLSPGDITRNNIRSVVTFKGPKLDNISMSRSELETVVEDGAVMRQILESIGFYSVPAVIKTRKEYSKDEINICLDQVEGLGSFMEIEIIVPSETEREMALKKIEKILHEFGLTWEDTLRHSYLSMLLGKNNN